MTASAGKGERGHPVKGGVTDGRGTLNEQLYRPDKAGDHTAIEGLYIFRCERTRQGCCDCLKLTVVQQEATNPKAHGVIVAKVPASVPGFRTRF